MSKPEAVTDIQKVTPSVQLSIEETDQMISDLMDLLNSDCPYRFGVIPRKVMDALVAAKMAATQ